MNQVVLPYRLWNENTSGLEQILACFQLFYCLTKSPWLVLPLTSIQVPPFVQAGKWHLLLKRHHLNYIPTPGIKCLGALVYNLMIITTSLDGPCVN